MEARQHRRWTLGIAIAGGVIVLPTVTAYLALRREVASGGLGAPKTVAEALVDAWLGVRMRISGAEFAGTASVFPHDGAMADLRAALDAHAVACDWPAFSWVVETPRADGFVPISDRTMIDGLPGAEWLRAAASFEGAECRIQIFLGGDATTRVSLRAENALVMRRFERALAPVFDR